MDMDTKIQLATFQDCNLYIEKTDAVSPLACTYTFTVVYEPTGETPVVVATRSIDMQENDIRNPVDLLAGEIKSGLNNALRAYWDAGADDRWMEDFEAGAGDFTLGLDAQTGFVEVV